MAALTAATTTRENVGSLTLLMFTFTTVSDTDTFASGLSTNVVNYWAQTQADTVTQASAGFNVTNSSGTFTFYPGENSLAATLFVLAKV